MVSDKWLILSTQSKIHICGSVWDACKKVRNVEHRIFESESALLDDVEVLDGSEFSRVIVDANLRRMGRRALSLGKLSNLVIFDHDICLQYCRSSEWYKKYITVIKTIGARRTIVSSESLRRDLVALGMDAALVLKGYDSNIITDLNKERDLPLAFVGRVSNKAYRKRKQMLQMAQKKEGLVMLRTDPGEAYNQALNRIEAFVSADVGFNEYMIKNYEAMAAGCALLAWRQPGCEQEAIGIEDGFNAMLYSSREELLRKIAILKQNPDVRKSIAAAGNSLVRSRHTWGHRGNELLDAISTPFSDPAPELTFMEKLSMVRL